VQFTVQPDGTVSQAQSIKSSNARLGNAAVEAIKQWRFAPIPKARDAAVEVAFRNDDQ
jgi:TonB family protein